MMEGVKCLACGDTMYDMEVADTEDYLFAVLNGKAVCNECKAAIAWAKGRVSKEDAIAWAKRQMRKEEENGR